MSGPIELVDAQPDWPAQYAEVAAELREVFATGEASIEHIGSTSAWRSAGFATSPSTSR